MRPRHGQSVYLHNPPDDPIMGKNGIIELVLLNDDREPEEIRVRFLHDNTRETFDWDRFEGNWSDKLQGFWDIPHE